MVCLLLSWPHTVDVETQIFHQEEEKKKTFLSRRVDSNFSRIYDLDLVLQCRSASDSSDSSEGDGGGWVVEGEERVRREEEDDTIDEWEESGGDDE